MIRDRVHLKVLSFLLIFSASVNVFAQKLSDVQTSAIAAPEKVKVDGKITEWDAFQAFNKATLLNYTISNDDKNLYLVVKSTDASNNTKILLGGISFLINTDGKKKDKDAFAVTYPLVERSASKDQRSDRSFRTPGSGTFSQAQGLSQKQRDSLVAARGAQALASVKEIKVIGFKNIPDSLISIYNEYGIKAAALFDATGAFQYELAIPLSSLGLSATAPKEFTYNIKLNGRQFGNREESGRGRFNSSSGGGFNGGSNNRLGGGGDSRRSGSFGGGDSSAFITLFTPTDFWGKYTLIKK